jgi:hypothetical protein
MAISKRRSPIISTDVRRLNDLELEQKNASNRIFRQIAELKVRLPITMAALSAAMYINRDSRANVTRCKEREEKNSCFSTISSQAAESASRTRRQDLKAFIPTHRTSSSKLNSRVQE